MVDTFLDIFLYLILCRCKIYYLSVHFTIQIIIIFYLDKIKTTLEITI